MKLKRLMTLILVLLGCGLDKVPLVHRAPSFSFAMLHWFENEGVAYLFFRLENPPNDLGDHDFSMEWTTENSQNAPLKFNTNEDGIHKHTLKPCQNQTRLCGSMSFDIDTPVDAAKIYFRFYTSKVLSTESVITVFNHEKNLGDSSLSAIPRAYFAEDNTHIGLNLHNNFGTPDHKTIIEDFLITRKIEIQSQAPLENLSNPVAVFDGSSCESVSWNNLKNITLDSGNSWIDEEFKDTADGTCLKLAYLDRNDRELISTNTVALRNPETSMLSGLSLKNPLRELEQIPLIIKVCPKDTAEDAQFHRDFFNYQLKTLGMPSDAHEICFQTKNLELFKDELKTGLSFLLTQKKLTQPDKDLFFVVLLHDQFGKEFFDFHSNIVKTLNTAIQNEMSSSSPRLLGAFVYSSQSTYTPAQFPTLSWCPQKTSESSDCFTPSLSVLSQKIFGIDIFTSPGPLPDAATYESYIKRFGKSALAYDTSLQFLGLPKDEETLFDPVKKIYVYDHERIGLNPGEFLRFCDANNGSGLLSLVRFLPTQDRDVVLSKDDFKTLQGQDLANGDYEIALSWQKPYIGSLKYKIKPMGMKVMGQSTTIPIVKPVKLQQAFGDSALQEESFPIGSYLWLCKRYCHNPFFDEHSRYQRFVPWNEVGQDEADACLPNHAPKWRETL